jgi:preprotein translocase subunit Sss1
MAEKTTVSQREESLEASTGLRNGAVLMALAGLAGLGFVGYGVVFLYRTFFGSGFELGVSSLGGVTRADLAASNPEMLEYINHLHVAVSGLLIVAGIGVVALAWYGVRSRQWWAWATAVAIPVVSLVIALPMHYLELFAHDWVTHLGPVYLAVGLFVIGAILSYRSLRTAEQVS